MLTRFDWLRRCRTGAELLATLSTLTSHSHLLDGQLGPPHSAWGGPCRRCWVYASPPDDHYCLFCQKIASRAKNRGAMSRKAVVIWGYVNQLPRYLETAEGFYADHALGSYAHDPHRFLLVVYRYDLKIWLQELVLYHGAAMKGLLQIIPTMGAMPSMDMGEALSQIVQREANYSLDRLRVQFYASPAHIHRFNLRDKRGKLTFEITEFMRMLEVATLFRTLLYPDEQQMLYQLLQVDDVGEAQFYWGRFLGKISQEAKDMLNAWKIRQWPANQIELLYEMIAYVEFLGTD